jgi:hypothetical protein
MSAYSDSVSEPAPVSAKKNIETEVEIGFFRPFPSVFIPSGDFIVIPSWYVVLYVNSWNWSLGISNDGFIY